MPRSVAGVILATTMFFPIERVLWIVLNYTTGGAGRRGQTLGYLASDFLRDFFFLVILGWTTAFPLWVLNALFLSFLDRSQKKARRGAMP